MKKVRRHLDVNLVELDQVLDSALEAEYCGGGVPRAAAEPDEYPGRPGPHEVQRRGVRGAAAHDHRHVELIDELLEVERLGLPGDVLGGNGGAADNEDIHARIDNC